MLRPSLYCDGVSRCDETKTIKPITNEAFVASSGDIITDYNDLGCVYTAGLDAQFRFVAYIFLAVRLHVLSIVTHIRFMC